MATPESSTEAAAESPKKPNLRKTLRLPSTSFPMRANLAQHEAASIKRWNAAGLYTQVCDARDGCDRFVFHDGPPFANGHIHVGHLLNKVLKDIVVRSKHMVVVSADMFPAGTATGCPLNSGCCRT